MRPESPNLTKVSELFQKIFPKDHLFQFFPTCLCNYQPKSELPFVEKHKNEKEKKTLQQTSNQPQDFHAGKTSNICPSSVELLISLASWLVQITRKNS